jgi:zinc and cadmium transporter
MHPAVLLVIYCALCIVASLFGGWVPLVMRLTHRKMQIAISFVSGMILGIGLLHLLPHSFENLGSIDRTVAWVLAGFLFMFFLERFFHFHHHDAPDDHIQLDEPPLAPAHAHATLDHDRDHAHVHAKNASVFSMGGAAIGLTLHGLVDGVAMAAAVQAEEVDRSVALAGFGAFLAIALHKPFDSLTIGTLMAAGDRSAASRHLVNALYSLDVECGRRSRRHRPRRRKFRS